MRPSEGVVGLDPLAARLADGDPRAARVQSDVAKDREWRAYLGAGGDPSLFGMPARGGWREQAGTSIIWAAGMITVRDLLNPSSAAVRGQLLLGLLAVGRAMTWWTLV